MVSNLNKSDRTVMIVDDELVVRQMIRIILEANGFRVVAEADDGAEAVSRYRALRPRITLMDICMPNMNGIEATREIISYDPDARVVLFSGLHRNDLAESARKAGARDALAKPVKIRELKEILHRVMLT